MLTNPEINQLALNLGQLLLSKNLTCSVAESCTGGLVCALITDISGSSQWFDRGFITYSNLAKQQMLGVSEQLIIQHGAVSESVACAMAEGALLHSKALVSVAITGIAGPGGGSPLKPVGTVWFAWSSSVHPTTSECLIFPGDRQTIRQQATQRAIEGLIKYCSIF